ncbi:hypothetical protein ACEWY4_012608 [Coilia grayii]|uniref:Ceramidase n=1 Tax=Coilia grayii TaxID=363190 RepID=A0ABD1K122_9TELE
MAIVKVWIFSVTVFCVTEASPPLLTVNLDAPPGERWAPLVQLFDKQFLRQVAADVIDSTVPKWVHHAVIPIVNALEKYMPPPYAKEIKGMASFYGADIADIILLNFAYEVTAFCTSIITQDSKGNLYHGRNLDYPHEILRNITIDVSFVKKGKELYRGTTFAGYVGLWTGQSSRKFTVSGDQRSKGYWWENVIAAAMKSAPASWLVRQCRRTIRLRLLHLFGWTTGLRHHLLLMSLGFPHWRYALIWSSWYLPSFNLVIVAWPSEHSTRFTADLWLTDGTWLVRDGLKLWHFSGYPQPITRSLFICF